MSKCVKCGEELDQNIKFCGKCGTKQIKTNTMTNDKKARVMNQEKKWLKPAILVVAVLVAGAGLWAVKGGLLSNHADGTPMFSPLRDPSARLAHAAPVKSEDQTVRIPLSEVQDGNPHFFAYSAGGKTITFFIVKAADGSLRTAFDACNACNHAKLGYRQEGSLVVCNNCGMGFKTSDIGKQGGGCTPIPITKSVDGQMIVLKTSDIEAGAHYF